MWTHDPANIVTYSVVDGVSTSETLTRRDRRVIRSLCISNLANVYATQMKDAMRRGTTLRRETMLLRKTIRVGAPFATVAARFGLSFFLHTQFLRFMSTQWTYQHCLAVFRRLLHPRPRSFSLFLVLVLCHCFVLRVLLWKFSFEFILKRFWKNEIKWN